MSFELNYLIRFFFFTVELTTEGGLKCYLFMFRRQSAKCLNQVIIENTWSTGLCFPNASVLLKTHFLNQNTLHKGNNLLEPPCLSQLNVGSSINVQYIHVPYYKINNKCHPELWTEHLVLRKQIAHSISGYNTMQNVWYCLIFFNMKGHWEVAGNNLDIAYPL